MIRFAIGIGKMLKVIFQIIDIIAVFSKQYIVATFITNKIDIVFRLLSPAFNDITITIQMIDAIDHIITISLKRNNQRIIRLYLLIINLEMQTKTLFFIKTIGLGIVINNQSTLLMTAANIYINNILKQGAVITEGKIQTRNTHFKLIIFNDMAKTRIIIIQISYFFKIEIIINQLQIFF